MTFKTFSLALVACFGFPWLTLVVIPFAKMRNLEPVRFTEENDGRDEVYVPRRAGRIADGSRVYGANGCYVCHTQLIRPSFAGSDLGRAGWAGFPPTQDNPRDTRRETTPFDFVGEEFAHIGLMRKGPDLSNVGNRIERYIEEPRADATEPHMWVYVHLYNPRDKLKTYWSTCPPQPQFFKTKARRGQGSAEALPVAADPGEEVVPTDEARALASYLLSMKKDDEVPYAIDYRPNKQKAQ